MYICIIVQNLLFNVKINGIMPNKVIYKVTFSRNGYVRKDGTRQVIISCHQNGRSIQINTKIFVHKSQLKDGFVCGHRLSLEYNRYLYKLKSDFERLELDMVLSGKQVTLSALRRQINEGIRNDMKLSEFVGAVNKSSTTRSEKTKATYITLVNQIYKFSKGCTISDIDVDFINSFIRWCGNCGLQHNTIVGRLKCIRALINEAIKRRLIKQEDDPFNFIKIPMMKNRDEFLSNEEIGKLERMKLKGKERKILNAFLFACYTGFRFSDLNSIKNENIKTINGKKWIIKKPLKTLETSDVTVKIPIYMIFDGKPLRMIDEVYNGNVERLCHIGNNSSANRTLKEVMRKAKIKDCDKRRITFHCARHTAATLLLQEGVPMTTVQKILGHTKLTTTQIYANVNEKVIENDVKKVFQKKKKTD